MKRKTYIILTLFYAFLIFVFSSISKPPSIEKPGFDVIEHVIEYSILGFLTLGCFTKRDNIKTILIVIIICSLYGILDEIHQYLVPGRYFSESDMLSNSIGSIIGVITLRYYKKF